MPSRRSTAPGFFHFFRRVLEAKVVVHIHFFFCLGLSCFKEELLWHTHGIFPQLQVVCIDNLTHVVSISDLSCWSALAVQRDTSVRLQLEEDQAAADLENRRGYISSDIKEIDRSLNLH